MTQGNGSNGKMEIKVGDKSIGVTSRDLVSVLLILLAGLGGYFVATQITLNQQHGLVAMQAMVDKLTAHQETLVALVHTNRQQMELELQRQNALLFQQTTVMLAKVEESTTTMARQFERIAHQLAVLNHNMQHGPGEQLPLDVPLPQGR